VPSEDADDANRYCDAVVATGSGHIRNFFVVYISAKPIIAISGTGGVADQLANRYLDEKRIVKVVRAASPEQAVKKALRILARETDRPSSPEEDEN
jgi:hypothetical protein